MKFVLKFFLFILLLSVAGLSSNAQSQYSALTWRLNTAYHSYLLREFHALYDERRDRFSEALASTESLKQYQSEIKKKYLTIMGEMPERTALNTQITGTIRREGFTIEKLIYESTPHHHVTANLYIPQGKGKFPAVLLFCGHEIEAKATESYQKTAQLFAKNGFVVLVIDPISQGERIQLIEADGTPLTPRATTEHTLLNAGANLLGTSVAAYQLWDNIRGLDYLETRREVDMSRIGCLGNSGGGNQTAYFMTYDDRVKVAALASFFTQRERYVELAGPQDGCQQIPFEAREHLEIADFAVMFAPKPLIILSGNFDFVDYRGTLKAFERLKDVYKRLDVPDQVAMFSHPDGHGISKPKREAAVSWFRKWLYQDSTKVHEGNLVVLSPKELLCTPTGQVLTSFENEISIPARGKAYSEMLNNGRGEFLKNASKEELQEKMRSLLGLKDIDQDITFENTGTVSVSGYGGLKYTLYREGEVPLPCLVFHPVEMEKVAGKTVIVLDENGKNTAIQNDSLISRTLQEGNALILADLRGFGETADDPGGNDKKYRNREYRNATISLYNGKPVMGQRVVDIMTLLDFIARDENLGGNVIINATALYQPAVLHAAVLDSRIIGVEFSGELIPYERYVSHPLRENMYTNVVPGVLKYYDLPDLVERLR